MEDINWDRIDKQKFFTKGIGMFSGVTTLLFPLTVIKTRQMANHEVSGGLQGMKQTIGTIWRHEGVPGFYRGFATVIFGTIPARMIYLTSLEMAKEGVYKLGTKMELSPTATAGLANFAGGAAASLSIQVVSCPIDVISQRQMVHGAEIAAARTPQPTTSTAATASQPPTAAGTAATVGGTSSTGQVRSYHTARHRSWGPGASGSHSHTSAALVTHPQGTCTTTQHTAHSALPPTQVARDCGRQHQNSHVGSSHASVTCPKGHMRQYSSTAAAAPIEAPSGLAVARMIIREEGVKGLYRGFGMSVATFVPSSAVWWSAYGVYTQLVSSAYISLCKPQPHPTTPTTSTTSTTSTTKGTSNKGAASAASPASTPAGGAPTSSSSSRGAGSTGSLASVLTGGEVVGLQVMSSLLAGATASLITNPFDLIKTRIQVAVKSQGQTSTVRGVLSEILREDGPAGLLRGALPRMVNSAMWGTCMVSVYEFLKRVSVKTDA